MTPQPQATSNFLAGNASFSSSDGSLAIDGGPAQGQIDFRLNVPALAAGVPLVLISAPINLLATQVGIPLLGRGSTPFVAPGRLFVPFNGRIMSTDLNGTIGVGGSINAGSDVAKVNVYVAPTQLSTAFINAIPASPAAPGGWINVPLPNGQALCNVTTPVLVDVTIPASGGTATAFTGRLMVAGYLI